MLWCSVVICLFSVLEWIAVMPSQRCGRLYFPMFLFKVGLFILMYMASFTALAILWSSLPIILKFSTDVMWPVLFWCSCIGDDAFRCPLYLSSKVLADSPIYCSLQSIMSHLNQYIPLLSSWCCLCALVILVNFKWFVLPWSIPLFHTFCKCFLKLSLIPWEYGTTIWHIFFL